MLDPRINLLDLAPEEVEALLVRLDTSRHRAGDLLKGLHREGAVDIEDLTCLNGRLRRRLAEVAYIKAPTVHTEARSSDGTIKWVMSVGTDAVETVYIPEGRRGTLCVSSQAGCALACTFCSTGRQGFNRNLSVSEIIGQLYRASARLKALGVETGITHIVMMGMGEPLLNFKALVKALKLMLYPRAWALSHNRITVSTSGVLPAMERLKEALPVSMSVSLHAPTDDLRDVLVPLNQKYPLEQLMDTCRRYFPAGSKRVITFEYVMLDGVNDSLEHAEALLRCLDGTPGKLNLIPFNPFPGAPYRCSTDAQMRAFQAHLVAGGRNTITRKTRGQDIDAACGQLVGSVSDRTGRVAREQQR
ncbi:MAG: 23S rRNA (adenine(2503)-C(2))-methyltransferase RlmN [Bradymonadia bacterium]